MNTYVTRAQETLTRFLDQRAQDVAVTPVGHYRPVRLPNGEVRWDVSVVAPEGVRKRMCVVVQIAVGDEVVKRVPVWFAVTARSTGWVTLLPLTKGTILKPEYVATALVDATEAVAMKINELARFRLARDVKAGETMSARAVEYLPPVYQGQQVTLRASAANIEFELAATAEEGGQIGEVIRVRRQGVDGRLRAKIVAPGILTLDGV